MADYTNIAKELMGTDNPDLLNYNFAPQRMPERGMRRIARKLMSDVDLTPDEYTRLGEHDRYKETVGEPTARKTIADLSGIPQAASAWSDVYHDPSLANATNAGVRSALVALRPAAALKILGAGYGAGVAQDAGLPEMLIPSANAQKKGAAPEPTPTLPGLTESQNAELAAARKKTTTGFASGADRRATEATIKRLEDLSAEYSRAKGAAEVEAERARRASEQAEYDRAVTRAGEVRDAELAKDKSFKDSNVGQIYEKTGGYAPLLAGVAGGAINRMAGKAGTGWKEVAIPAGEGAALTFAALNAPLAYDAFNAPKRNPQKSAWEGYARELPPTHPRKAEFTEYARGLREDNPVATDAWREFTDPLALGKRAVVAAVEGGPAGVLGSYLPLAVRNSVRGVGTTPGVVLEGFQSGMTGANVAREARHLARADALSARELANEAGRRSDGRMAQPVAAAPVPMAPSAPPVAPAEALPSSTAALRPPPNQSASVSRSPSGINYGAKQKSIARPYIASEVEAGRPVPTFNDVQGQLVQAGVPVPVRGGLPQKLDAATAVVNEMRAAGADDRTVATALRALMDEGKNKLPALAVGSGLGAGAIYGATSADADEPMLPYSRIARRLMEAQ